MTIGEWVTDSLISAAQDDAGGATRDPADPQATQPPSDTDQAMQSQAQRSSDLDRRDRALLEAVQRLLNNEHKNEERLAVLTSAMTALADRLNDKGAPGGMTGKDLDDAVRPLAAAVESLATRIDDVAGAPATVTLVEPEIRNHAQPDAHDGTHREAQNGRAQREPSQHFDYDALNERAMDNTRRMENTDEEPEESGSGLFSRLLGGD